MANDIEVVVTTVFNNEQLKAARKEIQSTFESLNRLNNSTLNTSNRQINDIQRQINDLFIDVDRLEKQIKQRQSTLSKELGQLEVKNTELEQIKKQFNSLVGQIALNIGEDVFDALVTIGSRGRSISSNQVQDILRTFDPRNDINEINAALAAIELLFKIQEKNNKEQILEAKKFRPPRGSGTRPVTPEIKEELLQDIANLDVEIEDLFGKIDKELSERFQREFPVIFEAVKKFQEIRAKEKEIGALEIKIGDNVSDINKDKQELEELTELIQILLKRRDELGNQIFPELDLGLESLFEDELLVPELEIDFDFETPQSVLDLPGQLAMIGDGFIAVSGEQSEFALEAENTTEKIDQQLDQINNADASLQGLINQNSQVINSEQQVKKSVEDAGNAMEDTGVKTEEFTEQTKKASETLTGLGVFAADVAANINDAFSDLIFNSLKGNLDNLGEIWDSTLDSMLESFSQFLATVISNPIRLQLEAFLTGDNSKVPTEGFGGAIASFFDVGTGFDNLGKVFGKIPGLSGIGESIGGLFAEGGALGFLGKAVSFIGPIGAAIGAIASIASPIISIVKDLFKKSPRLDIDIGVIKNDVGKRAATVEEFLDPALLDEVVNISVKRKAGLGLGGDDPIKEAISDVITASIETIQSIINQLPADLAAQLNETLLNADIDIESKIKGDKLLEFDETNVVSLGDYRNAKLEYKLAA